MGHDREGAGGRTSRSGFALVYRPHPSAGYPILLNDRHTESSGPIACAQVVRGWDPLVRPRCRVHIGGQHLAARRVYGSRIKSDPKGGAYPERKDLLPTRGWSIPAGSFVHSHQRTDAGQPLYRIRTGLYAVDFAAQRDQPKRLFGRSRVGDLRQRERQVRGSLN